MHGISIRLDRILEILTGQKLVVRSHILNKDLQVSGVCVDVKTPNSSSQIFCAYRGVSFDLHSLLSEAFDFGLLIFEDGSCCQSTQSWIQVKNSRKAWSFLSAAFYENPHKDLITIAVTGTNGKTSTAWLIKHLLDRSGIPCLYIGTLGIYAKSGRQVSNQTTPNPPEIFKHLKIAKSNGIKALVIEASSHALHQDRLAPIEFDYAIFTSFSRDHLDYHSSMEEYWQAKCKLFRENSHKKTENIIHASLTNRFMSSISQDFETYCFEVSSKNIAPIKSNYQIKSVRLTPPKTNEVQITYQNKTTNLRISLLGEPFLENLLAALICVKKILSLHELNSFSDLRNLPQIPGRMEIISTKPEEPLVIVDYAHTPDALEKILILVNTIKTKNLILVFGCGGNRDHGKRPQMGEIASRFCDQIILTNDNPRNENPLDILEQIKEGIPSTYQGSLTICPDRGEAIHKAIYNAKTGDLVIIAGKGHENTQTSGQDVFSFSDQETARFVLAKL